MKFWENVSSILEQRGLSQRALAREVNLTAGAVAKYAHGTMPGLDAAARIAQFLNVSLDALVWNDGDEVARPLCPAPADHVLVKEVVHELGLPDLISLSKLGTNWAILQVVDVLVKYYPAPVPHHQLRDAVPDLADDVLHASIVALKRKGIVESIEGTEGSIRLVHNVPHITAQELGDCTQNVKRAVKLLFTKILPALEQPVRTGNLLTVTGRLRRDKAEEFMIELTAIIKARFQLSAEAEREETDISMVFGIAYKPQSC